MASQCWECGGRFEGEKIARCPRCRNHVCTDCKEAHKASDPNSVSLHANCVSVDEREDEELIEAQEITFGLERDLQLALRANINQLEIGLKIIDGGNERVTEAGRIDITAEDAKGSTVVIELKAGTAKPDAVAQILAYMATVAEPSNHPVRGILVAGDFHKRVLSRHERYQI